MQFCVWHVRNIKPLMKYLMMYSEHLYANGFCCFKVLLLSWIMKKSNLQGFIIQQEEYIKALLYGT